jgi:hypothetical protein
MIFEIKNEHAIYNATRFLKNFCSYDELKNVFEMHLEEFFKDDKLVNDLNELCEAIAEQLNCFGWIDQDIIEEVLKQREEKYFVVYVPENHGQEDYFNIIEVEK